jgi:hypothetical protein
MGGNGWQTNWPVDEVKGDALQVPEAKWYRHVNKAGDSIEWEKDQGHSQQAQDKAGKGQD